MSSKSREKRKEEKEKTRIEEIVMGRLTYAKYFCMSLHGVNPASIPCILKGSSNIVYRVRRKREMSALNVLQECMSSSGREKEGMKDEYDETESWSTAHSDARAPPPI